MTNGICGNELAGTNPFIGNARKIPQGCPAIARRFNAGIHAESTCVPKGRLNDDDLQMPEYFAGDKNSAVPAGLVPFIQLPGVETPGYFHHVPMGH
jgi:hypothetical protein